MSFRLPIGWDMLVPIEGSLLLKFLGHRFVERNVAPQGGVFAGARIPLQSQLG